MKLLAAGDDEVEGPAGGPRADAELTDTSRERVRDPVRATDFGERIAHLQKKDNGLEGVLCARLSSVGH